MGLDMYLSASEYVSRYDYTENERNENKIFADLVAQFNVDVDPSGFAGLTIDFPMGYWRKANQIHDWFVESIGEGIDECQKMFVTREHLEALQKLCQEVLAVRYTPQGEEVAKDLLPPAQGFFFGSYDIDEYYYKDLENTLIIIDRCLKSKFEYFEYQASW